MAQLVEFTDVVEPPLSGTWAFLAGPLPVLRGPDVGVPERPCPALPRTDVVDSAVSLFWVEENTIAIGKLHQRCAAVDLTQVTPGKLVGVRFTYRVGNRALLLLGDPDNTGSPGTTIAATRATETKSILVPALLVH